MYLWFKNCGCCTWSHYTIHIYTRYTRAHYQEFIAVKYLRGLVVIAISQLLDLHKNFASYGMSSLHHTCHHYVMHMSSLRRCYNVQGEVFIVSALHHSYVIVMLCVCHHYVIVITSNVIPGLRASSNVGSLSLVHNMTLAHRFVTNHHIVNL